MHLPLHARMIMMNLRISDLGIFLGQVLRAPFSIGAICPSSPRLARLMVKESGVEQARQIVELGAGMGVITKEILKQKAASAVVLSLEINPHFSRLLQKRFPEVRVISACASKLISIARSYEVYQAQSIVSALPWTLFDRSKQKTLLKMVHNLLADDGKFVTIACVGMQLLPSGRDFHYLLKEAFQSVETTSIVWKNLPPAFIYACAKQRNLHIDKIDT